LIYLALHKKPSKIEVFSYIIEHLPKAFTDLTFQFGK